MLPDQAQEQLFHARRILGYSYVYAFYMFGGELYGDEISAAQNATNQNLFEDQQQQLESEVWGQRYDCPPPALTAVQGRRGAGRHITWFPRPAGWPRLRPAAAWFLVDGSALRQKMCMQATPM